MVIVTTGNGEVYLDENLKKNLEAVKDSVNNKNWDYFAVIAGIPRAGKSTMAQQVASFLDDTFNVDRICFTAKEYIEKSSKLEKGQAIILDESFADLNTNLSRSPDFIRILNHMQVIGQKNLFHILVLPDFFALSQSVALYRASHLFVVYAEDYGRGRFAAFDRDRKSQLYEDGKKYRNYKAVVPNFRGRFVAKWLVDEKIYKERKQYHLEAQAKVDSNIPKDKLQRNIYINELVNNCGYTQAKVARLAGLNEGTISLVLHGNRTNFSD